jgi:hypothetical protein
MKLTLFTVALGVGLAAPLVVLAQQKAPPFGQQGKGAPGDPDGAFRQLDTNRDGRVDRAEFARIAEISPRFSGQRDSLDAIFQSLDKNGDKLLTLEEYRGVTALQLAAKRMLDDPSKKSAPAPATTAFTERTPSADELNFFESKIRPVLADKCYKCHSTAEGAKVKGGLVLDSKEGARKGGDSGPAVVPGNTRRSLLLEAIRYSNKDLQMPPEKEGGKLSDAIIRDFETWIAMGAPDPRSGGTLAKKEYDGSRAKDHWAYQPPKKSPAPTVQNSAWPRGDVDRFVLAALESKGLAPVADADKLALVRRVYFDLIGLPPTFAEITSFVEDKSPDALAKVVDKLLASPQFGERWGRHWLDVARYGESSGKDVNVAFPHAWRYRDYVIAAFNADKPYDRFVQEQIAGDLLPARDARQTAEHAIATGFLALGTKSMNEQNPRQFWLDVADEQIDTMSQAILGTTVACARCHDHKFDPIAQKEYYALAGIFTSTESRFGTAASIQNRHATELVELPAGSGVKTLGRSMSPDELQRSQKKLADYREQQRGMFGDLAKGKGKGPPTKQDNDPQRQLERLRLIAEAGQLDARLKMYDESGQEKALAMGVRDLTASRATAMVGGLQRLGQGRFAGFRPPEFSAIGDASLYTRGDVDKPAEKVPRAFPVALTHSTPPRIPSGASGRRELAQWLTDSNNPLTARVYVNRVWGWLFGRGIVDSPDNFGTTGGKPANQALLDTLAVRFIENGWSTKKLVREIVLSRTYQLSTQFNEKNHEADPDNALHWRMSPRRLDAESIRDAMLAVSGELDPKPLVGSVVARVGDLPIGGPRLIGLGEAQVNAEDFHRSVYQPIVRDMVPDTLALFDFPEPSLVSGTRDTTSVPSQALYMMNSDFVRRRAESLAQRVTGWKAATPMTDATAQFRERVNVAYWLVFTRPPNANELAAATDFFTKFNNGPGRGASNSPALQVAAWTSFCRALMASAEFRYLN